VRQIAEAEEAAVARLKAARPQPAPKPVAGGASPPPAGRDGRGGEARRQPADGALGARAATARRAPAAERDAEPSARIAPRGRPAPHVPAPREAASRAPPRSAPAAATSRAPRLAARALSPSLVSPRAAPLVPRDLPGAPAVAGAPAAATAGEHGQAAAEDKARREAEA